MAIFILPDDLFPGEAMPVSNVIFHTYSTRSQRLKEKSLLQRNAVSLVIKGEKTMHFAEKTIYTNDHEIHFLSAGNCIASVDVSKKAEFESILVFFDDIIIKDFYVKHNDLIESQRRKVKLVPHAYVSITKDDFIVNYITSIQIMLGSLNKLSPQMMTLKLEELFLYLLEKHAASFLSFEFSKQKMFNEFLVRQVVESNITTRLTVDELAFLCNLSASSFKRHFVKIYHTSPGNWFLEQKMKMAATLLKDHQERAGDICHKLGFDSHTGFTKSFRKFYGVSPTTYRGSLTV